MKQRKYIIKEFSSYLNQNQLQLGDYITVFPSDIRNLSEIFKTINRNHQRVIIDPLPDEINSNFICISTRDLNNIIEYDSQNEMITIEYGTTFKTLSQYLKQEKIFIPLVDFPLQAKVGKFISNLTPFSYFASSIIAVKYVLPSGDIINYGCKTLKNVAGYDLSSLIIGMDNKLALLYSVMIRVFKNSNFVTPPESYEYIVKKSKTTRENSVVFSNLKKEIDPYGVLS